MTAGAVVTMRLLTWNIHKGIGGLDRRYDPDRIVEVIRHHEPDVVLLQEIDEDVPRSRHHRQVDVLGDALGFTHRAFAPNVKLKHGHYGNATLARFPMVHTVNVNLTLKPKKARGALLTELAVPGQDRRFPVHIANWHLGLSALERRWQVAKLLRASALKHLDPHSRLVIAGDANDWSGAVGRWLVKRGGFTPASGIGNRRTRTWPAWRPVGALDCVYGRGALQFRHHFTSRLKLAREASDHLPLVVDLDLDPR